MDNIWIIWIIYGYIMDILWICIWLVVWNMNFVFPNSCSDDPIWLSYFSEGLKPPTRYIYIYIHMNNMDIIWIIIWIIYYLQLLWIYHLLCNIGMKKTDYVDIWIWIIIYNMICKNRWIYIDIHLIHYPYFIV